MTCRSMRQHGANRRAVPAAKTQQHAPCPFCPPDVRKNLTNRPSVHGHYVNCLECGSTGPYAPSRIEAWVKWDARHDEIARRDTEIGRMKRRIAELETPDVFWPAEHDRRWGNDGMFPHESTAVAAADYTESYRMEPIRVERARALRPVWIVEQQVKPHLIYEGKIVVDEAVAFHEFPTQEAAEAAARQMREAAVQEDGE